MSYLLSLLTSLLALKELETSGLISFPLRTEMLEHVKALAELIFVSVEKAAEHPHLHLHPPPPITPPPSHPSPVILALAQGAVRSEVLSFVQFASWYNGGGYELMGWLELLSLAKWPVDIMALLHAREHDILDSLQAFLLLFVIFGRPHTTLNTLHHHPKYP